MLKPSLQASPETLPLQDFCLMLSNAQASGTLHCQDAWLRIAKGNVVKASLPNGLLLLKAMLRSGSDYDWRGVPGQPSGSGQAPLLGLLMGACAQLDEAQK